MLSRSLGVRVRDHLRPQRLLKEAA